MSEPGKGGRSRRLSLSRNPFSSRNQNDDVLQSKNSKLAGTQQGSQEPSTEKDLDLSLGHSTQSGDKPAGVQHPPDRTDICVSPTWEYADERKKQRKEKKRMEKDQKQLEKDQKLFAKRLKQLEDSDPKREGRSSKRDSRRLIKKQPLGSSSRASSANAEASRESSTAPVFPTRAESSHASRSSSSQRPVSSHANEPPLDSIQGTLVSNNAKENSPTMPPLSGNWPERFGPTISKDLAFSYRRAYASNSSEEPSKRSLHATAKYADLRRTAQSSPDGSREQQGSANPSSLDHRPLSSDGNKPIEPQAKDGAGSSVPKAEKSRQRQSTDVDRASFTAALKERPSNTGTTTQPQSTDKTEHSSDDSSKTLPAVPPNARVSRASAANRLSTSRIPNNDVNHLPRTTVPGTGRPASAVFFGTSTRSSLERKGSLGGPTPHASAANTSCHRRSGTVVLSKPMRPVSESPEGYKTVPVSQSVDESKRSANGPPAEDSQQQRPNFARRLSQRLGLGDKKAVEARRRSDSIASSSSKNSTGVKPSIPVLSKEAVLANLRNSRPNSATDSGDIPSRSSSFLHPSSALMQGRPDRNGQSSRASSQKSVRSIHSTQYESISELEEIKCDEAMTTDSSNNELTKPSSRRSSQESLSDGYNTAYENMSNAESLGRISPAISANLFPSVPAQNKSDDNVSRNTINPSSAQEHTNTAPSPTDIITNGTNTSSINKKTTSPPSQHPPTKPIAKVFVICCHCKFWHDIPSKIYATLALTSGPSTPREKPMIHSPLVPVDQRSSSSLSVNANGSGVKCCWCNHIMNKSCCEGWTTIVYKHEKLH